MNTHLFPLALILLLLTDCSTKKEAPAPTQPRVTHSNRMGTKPQEIRKVPVVSPSGAQHKATPDTATLMKPLKKKEHIYKGFHEARTGTDLDNHTRLLTIMSEHTNSATNNIVYPDYYGGVYYDDVQRLVVMITESDSACSQVKELKERLGNSRIIYRTCKNSYNSLLEVQDTIMAQFKRKTPLALNIGMFGIFDTDNKVGIHLTDASDERKQELFDLIGKEKVIIIGTGPITIIDD